MPKHEANCLCPTVCFIVADKTVHVSIASTVHIPFLTLISVSKTSTIQFTANVPYIYDECVGQAVIQ